ncbi:MAG: thiamine phosphate synthase [Dehalococcoidia bacterium]|nr:thiamine phosphate synthase [Dehalococcoidia bacterium]MDW8120254.1 thiamine phosphate synthase [Chloroflexota bacterium]
MPLPRPCLALVTDRRLYPTLETLVEAVAQAVEGGVDLVQVREKDLPGGPLLEVSQRLREVTRGRALLFVNERVDVALLCGADGVHLPEAGLPPRGVRRLVGARLLIGASVHSVPSALRAQQEGADLLIAGTIFPSRSHPGQEAVGVGLLADLQKAVTLPVLAIGGVTPQNAGACIQAGASGVAVITAILGQPDPRAAAQRLKEAIRQAWEKGGWACCA